LVCTLKIRRSPTAALTERGEVFAGQGRGDAVRRWDAGCERRRAEVIDLGYISLSQQLGDFAAIIPILWPLEQAGPHRIFDDVLLFDVVAFLRSQDVIKKFPLPQRRRQFRHAKDFLCGPLLESAHETRKRGWVDASAGGAEKVQMVRHYDKGPYCPTMTRWSGFEFPAKPREERGPVADWRCM
jgi:hypothetical protein